MLKVEFEEEKKAVSHVGLYRGRNGSVVLFANEDDSTNGIVVKSAGFNGAYQVGFCGDGFVSCTDTEIWTKLGTDTITFTW